MTPRAASPFSERMVIFVGGTSFSGSTLVDMMLANDPAGLSCGEVYAIFYPYRRHHLLVDELGNGVDWRQSKPPVPSNSTVDFLISFPIADSSWTLASRRFGFPSARRTTGDRSPHKKPTDLEISA